MCLEDDDTDIDLEAQPMGKNYMCEDCGKELTEAELFYNNYIIGKVIEVEEMKSPLKKTKVQVNPESEEDALQIVTNAKHVAEGDLVVVACENAIVPAG